MPLIATSTRHVHQESMFGLQDQEELSYRQRAHAYLSPMSLSEAWGSFLQPSAKSVLAHPAAAGGAQLMSHGKPLQNSCGEGMAGLSPHAAAKTRAQTPLQHALLDPGEVRSSVQGQAPLAHRRR